MSYLVHPDGTVECGTPQEAIALARAMRDEPNQVKRRPIASTDQFERTLRDLCKQVSVPLHEGQGPKPVDRRDVLYACALKVYKGLPARQSPVGGPHYNTILLHMGSEAFMATINEGLKLALDRLGGGKLAYISWGALTSKAPAAKRNERALRKLCEVTQTLSER